MSNELCPYCGWPAESNAGGLDAHCSNQYGCSAFDLSMPIEEWNRRFVRLDKNGDKVFAGDNIRLTAKEIGKDDDPFESVITLEPCISQDGVDMSLRYTETEATEAGIIMEIELVKEGA